MSSDKVKWLDKIIQWGATALVSAVVSSTGGYIRTMSASINALNVSVGQILERSVFLEKALDSLSTRILKIEERHDHELPNLRHRGTQH